MAKTTNARWTAGYPVEVAGRRIEPGDTCEIPEAQAKNDTRWKPTGGGAKKPRQRKAQAAPAQAAKTPEAPLATQTPDASTTTNDQDGDA